MHGPDNPDDESAYDMPNVDGADDFDTDADGESESDHDDQDLQWKPPKDWAKTASKDDLLRDLGAAPW